MTKEIAINKPFEVVMVNKPQMAVAYENKKLRDYTEVERKTKTFELVDYILNLLGVNEGKLEQHAVALDLISQVYLNLTFEELKLAFQMYASSQFYEDGRPMFISQQLNGVVIGKVVSAYERDKKEKLVAYERERAEQLREKPKEPTEEEKEKIVQDGMDAMYNNWVETGQILGASDSVYFRIRKNGDMPKWSEEETIMAKEEASVNLELQAKQDGIFNFEDLFNADKSKDSKLNSATRKVLLSWYYNRLGE